MDKLLEKQLQSYVPPEVMKTLINDRTKYQIARHIVDRTFKHKPHLWKTVAFPEYDDFFQAAISGFNPYTETTAARDKGVLQAIESYNPYKRQDNLLLQVIGGVEQAFCPCCHLRGEDVSLWPATAGNNTVPAHRAPEPVFFNGNKYCGREVEDYTADQLKEWIDKGLVRISGKKILCNYSNRLASLKNHISNQLGYLIKDIRSKEYHPDRSLRRHPHYACPSCRALVPDFNTSTTKTVELKCQDCEHEFPIAELPVKLWRSRGANNTVSLQDTISDDGDSRITYEETISIHNSNSGEIDSVYFSSLLGEKTFTLIDQLIDRIRYLAASSIGEKQYQRLLEDPTVPKDEHGVPETLNFRIFYNYFFTDNPDEKVELLGRAKNKSDETSTYRQLALKFLKKEQHYTICLQCEHKMYEPTESAKFKKAGPRTSCEECNSTKVKYHGPKCAKTGCKEHGDVEIVMYIFQTIEPKIRRLEKLVQEDPVSKHLYEQIHDLQQARDNLLVQEDMARILNY